MPIKSVFSLRLDIALFRTLSILTLLFSINANANCNKEDVSYYLKQGFNHQQVVMLCAPEPTEPQATHTPAPIQQQQKPLIESKHQPLLQPQQTPRNSNSGFGFYGNPDAVFLATAVEAYDVEITDNAIIFTRKDCFDYGWEDWNEFQERACPNVRYSIERGGLRIVERDNGLFGFGSTALFITGEISAEILDLEIFRPEHRKQISATIQSKTHKLKINVRQGMPQSKVEAILLKIAG